MEDFRKKLEKDLIWYRMLIVLFLLLYIVLIFIDKSKLNVSYFGMLGGVIAVAVMRYLVIRKAIKNDEKLRKMYVETYDERSIYVAYRASEMAIRISKLGLFLAGIVASFFNMVVFNTLIAASLTVVIVYCIMSWYFGKKM